MQYLMCARGRQKFSGKLCIRKSILKFKIMSYKENFYLIWKKNDGNLAEHISIKIEKQKYVGYYNVTK